MKRVEQSYRESFRVEVRGRQRSAAPRKAGACDWRVLVAVLPPLLQVAATLAEWWLKGGR